ncbi:MAG: lipid-A-disaccharide synthase [Chlamydiota bacterium]
MGNDLFIFAGEASGDLHGEKLLKELYTLNPKLKIKGVGGPKMRAVGLDCILPMEEFQVMGFIDVFPSLPRLYGRFKRIKKEILTDKPKAVVTIDYPGFSLRLAKALARKGSEAKRIHYVCPTVWAWGKGRISSMERFLDRVLTILPFEADLFSKDRISATYVGQPLISRIENHRYESHWQRRYGIENRGPILSIFPGSREKEIGRNFPLQLKVAKKIQQAYPELLIAISCSDDRFLPLLKRQGKDLMIIQSDHSYELMQTSHLAIATSGTVTLELALHHIPTVVTYAMRPLDVLIAQNIFQIDLPHFALPNIIVSGELFPELFGPRLKEKTLYQKTEAFMSDQSTRSECIEKCKKLGNFLGKKDAGKEAARAIVESLSG